MNRTCPDFRCVLVRTGCHGSAYVWQRLSPRPSRKQLRKWSNGKLLRIPQSVEGTTAQPRRHGHAVRPTAAVRASTPAPRRRLVAALWPHCRSGLESVRRGLAAPLCACPPRGVPQPWAVRSPPATRCPHLGPESRRASTGCGWLWGLALGCCVYFFVSWEPPPCLRVKTTATSGCPLPAQGGTLSSQTPQDPFKIGWKKPHESTPLS